ncbi:MAG TPA: HAD-IB family hydrolase [Solirubrobacteraceae bacterium]|jgi:HAD superfamily hydrolase (TIGR01490 family)|nr:HAD-IB family hydrolase [Solirubrobacteraceae bacterium]
MNGAETRVGTPAAFFDLDRTLMAGSSGFHWVRAARRAGMVSRRRLLADAWTNARFRLRGSTDAETEAVRERLGAFLAGRRVAELERLGPQVLAGVLPRIYPRMLELAWGHQDAGRPVYICTAATQDMADVLAMVLGFDGAAGTRLQKRDGHYTGRLEGPMCYREGKPLRMREIARRDGIDLSVSWGYSDSESDLPMLRAVGHAVVVNPDAELARVAREEGWEVMRFETLGRRLKVGAALAAAAAGAGAARARRVSR